MPTVFPERTVDLGRFISEYNVAAMGFVACFFSASQSRIAEFQNGGLGVFPPGITFNVMNNGDIQYLVNGVLTSTRQAMSSSFWSGHELQSAVWSSGSFQAGHHSQFQKLLDTYFNGNALNLPPGSHFAQTTAGTYLYFDSSGSLTYSYCPATLVWSVAT